MSQFWRHLDKLESYICRVLLSAFVLLLFWQIVSRQVFGQSITWIEELSVFMFVWFVYFGASYAIRIGAHNRVTFQFGFLSRDKIRWIEAFSDLIWVGFNLVMLWVSYDFVFNRMNTFIKAQTLGWPLKWVYMILPIAFAVMTIRILQVNYLRLVKGIDPSNPEKIDIDTMDAEETK